MNSKEMEEIEREKNNNRQDSGCLGRDLNPVPPKHKSEASPLESTCSAYCQEI